MTDTVSISRLKLEMSIGAYEWEKTIRQTVFVDVDLFVDTRAAGLSDSLPQAVDYSVIASNIIDLSKQKHFQLIEAFAESIASLILESDRVSEAAVKVIKPGALNSADSVSVSILRSN